MSSFDSMKAASSALKIPIPLLKRAKGLGCPAFAHGRVDSEKLKKWLAERKVSTPASASGEAMTLKEQLECARLRVQVERAQFNLDVERRKYQPISEVEQWVAMIVSAARQRFLALPRKVAPHVVGLDANQVAVVIEDAVREILDALANEPWPENLKPDAQLEAGQPVVAPATA